jgi:hypothetical protein
VSVSRGRLQISNDKQLGNSAGTVTASAPGMLEFTGDVTTIR